MCDAVYVSYLNTGFGVYSGLFHSTAITESFDLFIYIIVGTILLLTAYYPRWIETIVYSRPTLSIGTSPDDNENLSTKETDWCLNDYETENMDISSKNQIMGINGPQFSLLEYPLIILFIILGGISLMSSSDVLTMYLAIELQSYGLYILVTLNRYSEWSTSAGLTYFLLGGLSSCFILLGLALLYTGCGLTSLDGVYIFFSMYSTKRLEDIFTTYSLYTPQILGIGFLIISVGYLFKISAVPFHFWSPDVNDAIPTIVTTFVAIIAKISILIFLLELVYYTGRSKFGRFNWTYILLISSFLSLMVGAIVGLVQFRIKRLLSYSTISHVGFLLLALTVQSTESIQAFMFYLMQYSLSNINIFFIIILIGYSLVYYVNIKYDMLEETEMENSPIQLLTQLKGYFQLNPILALSLAITLFSFMGIPPLIGFFAKQLVLSAALQNGYYFLTITGILTSVISAVYYLATVKLMFFDESEIKVLSFFDRSPIKALSKEYKLILSSALTAVVTILTLIILLFILYPQIWLSSANILAMILSTL